MDVRIGVPDENIKPGVLNAGLEAVTRLNEDLIKTGKSPTFDEAIENGVKWKPEPPGLESFDHGMTVHKRGWGDCDDLAPLHAATLRVTGEDPGARAVVYKSGPHRWHAVTQHSDGSYSDPSQTAGMRVSKGSAAAGIPPAVVAPMARSNGVHGEPRPFVAVSRDSGAWVGRTDLPFGRSKRHVFAVTHRDSTPARALAGSMTGACIVGGCSGMVEGEHVDKLWALSGLLKGQSPKSVAGLVGVDTTKDAIRTIAELCPAILTELKAHRDAVERARGGRAAGRPFDPDIPRAFDSAETVGFSFGGLLHDVGKVVKGATGVIQGVVSLVPGIGTGISAAIGAGMTLLQGGSPLDIAVNAAFGAIPIPPGARELAHTALDAVMSLVKTGNFGDAAVAAVRRNIPSGLPQQVFDTLAHLVLTHKRGRATTGIVVHPPGKPTKIVPLTKPEHFRALHKIAPVALAPMPHPKPLVLHPPKQHSRGAWVFA